MRCHHFVVRNLSASPVICVAVLQSIMGGLFMWNSIGLIEDLGLEEHYNTTEELYKAADDAYSSVSLEQCPLHHYMPFI